MSNAVNPLDSQYNRVYHVNDEAPTLGHSNGYMTPKILIDENTTLERNDSNNQGGGRSSKQRIRRLTEIECERLQGFPDNHTQYGVYEKQVWINKKEKTFRIVEGVEKVSKTQRYKMCGNAVSTVIVAEIGKRLKECIF